MVDGPGGRVRRASNESWPRLAVRFEQSPDALTATSVASALAALNDVYEVVALATVPGYELVQVPSHLAPRRKSRLASEDQLRVLTLGYGSDLTTVVSVVADATNTALWGGALIAAFKALPAVLNTVDRVTFFRRERELKARRYDRDALEHRLEATRMTRELLEHRRRIADLEQHYVNEMGNGAWAAQAPVIRVCDGDHADERFARLVDEAVRQMERTVGHPTFETPEDGPSWWQADD